MHQNGVNFTKCAGSLFSPSSLYRAFSRYHGHRNQRFANNVFRSRYGYKRVPVDRIAMGLIKRGGEVTGGSNVNYNNEATELGIQREMLLDSKPSPVLRQKRSVDMAEYNGMSEMINTLKQNGDENDQFYTTQDNIDKPEYGVSAKWRHDAVKGRLDKIGSHFVNKDTAYDTGTNEKRLDRISMGFVKKSAHLDSEKRGFDDIASELHKQNPELAEIPEDKRGLDRLNSGFVKKALDRISSSFIKKDIVDGDETYTHLIDSDEPIKRGFDRLSGFVKKDSEIDSAYTKRVDRPSEGITEDDTDLLDALKNEKDKRGLDRLSMGFVKKEDNMRTNENKRGLDRLSMGFVKKEDNQRTNGNKRGLDRLSMGFVKKEDNQRTSENKRGLDRLSMGFVKKEDNQRTNGNKRGLDRLSMGFVNKEDNQRTNGNKRGLDRLSMGFVKKEDSNKASDNKRVLDHLSMDFIKNLGTADENVDKRRIDRLTMGFVKKKDYNDDIDEEEHHGDKRRLDRVSSGFIKKDETVEKYRSDIQSGDDEEYIGTDKRRFDRLSMGFVKKNLNTNGYSNIYDGGFTKDKRRIDRIFSGFVKKDTNGNYYDNHIDTVDTEDLQKSKRRFDRLSSGFVKRQYNKRRFDRLSMGFVKKDPELTPPFDLDDNYINKRLDQMERNVMEPNYNFAFGDDRGMDKELRPHSVVKRNADMRDLTGVDDKRAMDRIGYGFIKRSPYKRSLDRVGYAFVKKRLNGYDLGPDNRDVDQEYNRLVTKQYPYSEAEREFIDRLGPGSRGDTPDEYELDKQSILRLINELADTDSGKRYIDRTNSGFVLRGSEKGGDETMSHGYAYANAQMDKRAWTDGRAHLDRIGYGFIKRDGDGFINDGPDGYSIYSNAGPKTYDDAEVYEYANRMKKGFDRLNYGLIKRRAH